ncbi:hypothetical protein EJ04DRAFT_340036 [Polyplosphaeria fusca]|uniref:Ribosomal protein S15 n=1 Tax=Polyplosphaeria fusca TaxID=682080 RepID=A0A9P4QTS9_9PLEO|nr:hypothetical protein EJ04DRAFT_340036 [Polyplosphaeria fusca]
MRRKIIDVSRSATAMPPRIPLLNCLRAAKPSTPQTLTLPLRPFSSTPVTQSKTSRLRKNVTRDPYIIAQRERKKSANLARRAELEEQRLSSLGDPIRGNSTPFVESFETGSPIEFPPEKKVPQDTKHLNYALKPEDVQRSLEASKDLAVPRTVAVGQEESSYFPGRLGGSTTQKVTVSAEQVENDHERAAEAIARITALDNGSSKDRMRANIARCVSTFGRHNTDKLMPSRAPALHDLTNLKEKHTVRPETNVEAVKNRIGPDTGSSEVQIAILTAKIKTLADFLETRGKGDKHNKRNLRLLVHRRQKLLQYLRKKERGGPRWQHCIETLGLTEGTWKGEISL